MWEERWWTEEAAGGVGPVKAVEEDMTLGASAK